MIEQIVRALHSKNVQLGARDSATIGLVSGFLIAAGEHLYLTSDMSLATTEMINTAFPTSGALLLGYVNMADKEETVAGVVSANLCHRVAYYGTKGAFALMRYYQL